MTWRRCVAAVSSVCACTIGCSTTPPLRAAPDTFSGFRWEQEIRQSRELDRLEVRARWWGGAPGRWVPSRASLVESASGVAGCDGAAVALDARGIAPSSASEGCVRFTVDLARAGALRRRGRGDDDATMLSVSSWLWRPERPSRDRVLRWELAEGQSMIAPWEPVEGGGGRVFRVDDTALAWENYVLVGRFARQSVTAAGAVFDVARVGSARGLPEERVRRWVARSAEELGAMLGRFPVARVMLVLTPAIAEGDAVTFGITSLGGGASVVFTVYPEATDEGFARDWIAVHEFTHLAMPVTYDDDAWLREGLATWYQLALRVRSGRITPRVFWHELLAGFESGRASPSAGTLEDDSAAMGRGGGYLRVYWSATAIALLAEVELRRRSQGREGIDGLMRGLWREAVAAGRGEARAWSAGEVGRAFDRAAGNGAWGETVGRWLRSREFPAVEEVIGRMGVRRTAEGVTLDDAAPEAGLRDAITRASGP